MSIYNNSKRLIFLIGLYQVSQPILALSRTYYNQFMRQSCDKETNRSRLQKLYGGKDAYALVTGSSDGIGKSTAQDLARHGFNLILASRSADKLDQVARQCKDINPDIKVQKIPIDFASAQPHDIKEMFEQINDKNVTLLFNNVGINDQVKFLELDPQRVQDMITVNIFTQVFMTKYTRLLVKQNQNKSAFVHLSSILSQLPLPFHAQYSATKRFNDVFGKMFGQTANHYGLIFDKQIDTLIVRPSGVTTPMTQFQQDPLFVKPGQVSFGELRAVGVQDDTNGAYWHCIQGESQKYLPIPVVHKVYKFLGSLNKAPYK
ncbi:short chain dehydrogenase reductase family protein [Stylonychia lemnae]|uniref:Short chain dehydrogenase reductase family protein n=1 Tax=Stylonychia lemnae TaxID=5949 RepID=A0A078B572_STYLE|nr:short chain dehydrogenase reductase family protein [Stylonychia lemnae]|eukprot:CDW89675.1 short chain dehydrogenase reductase family protein [Stylonychia lemnae]